jgi:hypothetical protein
MDELFIDEGDEREMYDPYVGYVFGTLRPLLPLACRLSKPADIV